MTAGNDFGTITIAEGPNLDRLIIDWTLGPAALYNATSGSAANGAAVVNGNATRCGYDKEAQIADHHFHTSMHTYQNQWDAPWTSHTLHSGDVVDIILHNYVPQVNGSTFDVQFELVVQLS